MVKLIEHTILGNTFLLSADRCMYWQEEKTLILSDLHLGKTGHFRKAGIAVPQAVFKEDMQRLVTQLQLFKPISLIIIGDMFHSHGNKEHEFFLKWRNDFPELAIQLVKGNHDILEAKWYEDAGIKVYNGQLAIGNINFVHDIASCLLPIDNYTFSGHIHPGISIRGIGKQSLRFPCFYFGEQYAVLPAFSRFTGTYLVEQKKQDAIFAIVENKLLRI